MLTRINQEVDDRVAKASRALRAVEGGSSRTGQGPRAVSAIQSGNRSRNAAKHAARKHAHACEYAKDAVAKFLDMVCVVLKVREDNGRKPMPTPTIGRSRRFGDVGRALFCG